MFYQFWYSCFTYCLLYCTYVRPILEYSSQVWSPCLLLDIDTLERVQRYFTRRLFARAAIEQANYQDRLSYLKLEPLELRRLKSDLVMVFKCLNGEVGCNNVFQLSHTTHTRGHAKKLTKQNFRTNSLKHNFFVRVVDAWNQLPSTVNEKPLVESNWSGIQWVFLI